MVRGSKYQEPMSFVELESEAAEIRHAILLMLNGLKGSLPTEKSTDLLHVVDAWFYAIIIFGYRALGSSSETERFVESDCDCLFEALSSLSSPMAFAQNQPWPLFIAGTECVGDRDKQLWVQNRLESLIKLVCPLDRPRMLEFLKDWWKQSNVRPDRRSCWMEFRQDIGNNKDFIIW